MSSKAVEGVDKLERVFEALAKKIETPGMLRVMERGMGPVANAARDKVARDSGEVHDSIRIFARRKGDLILGHVGTDVFYARWLEKGRRKGPPRKEGMRPSTYMAARPFLRPALREARDAATREIAQALREIVVRP